MELVLDMSRVKETITKDLYHQLVDRALQGLPKIGGQGRLVINDAPRDWWSECYQTFHPGLWMFEIVTDAPLLFP